ncbi:cation-translocating P-type ATPase [Demequina lutea]|uniref:Calcium-translocating P-type ATPase n=1 Tax=Demequina lutea TaxID=431489 RepID=A0A7Y9ZCG2_9MICO|nr:HAD-IC family P-type ATPase [Demequina lutea]NYI41663.1 calcium-translocating P-type ATPase [Demequina lutea]
MAADVSLLTADEVVRLAGADTTFGLSSEEAAIRLAADGPNSLTERKRVSWQRRLLLQFADPLVYLLLAAFAVTITVWLVDGREGVPYDSIVIAIVVIANAILGLVQERRSESAVAALQHMSAASALVMRNGNAQRIPAAGVVRGDLLLLAEGDAVAADARLVTSELRVAEAVLTGESAPAQKRTEPLEAHAEVADRTCMVFAGTAVSRGTGRAIVTGIGMDTETGRIARMLGETEPDPTPLQREIAHLSRTLGIAVVVIAVVVIGTVWLTSDVTTLSQVVSILLLGVALAVAAVPEGLPAILSVVLSLGVRRMADHHAIVKDLSSVETLGSASVICTDKTGTLTLNRMTLMTVATAHGLMDIADAAASHPGASPELTALIRSSCVANDAVANPDGGEINGDPTDVAFLDAERLMSLGGSGNASENRVAGVPFSAARARMSAATQDASGERTLHVKGGPEVLLSLSTRMLVGETQVPLDAAARERVLANTATLAGRGMRTLGVAFRTLSDGEACDEAAEQDLTFIGVAGLVDPSRPEARDAVADAQLAGIRIVMITGDHPATALAIARDLGIAADETVLTGAELASMSDAELGEAVANCAVFARVAPELKLRIVDAFQARGEVVAMTGDGVNDAPALRSADIGVAMGLGGTEVAREASSMILADDNFTTIVTAVREGRGILDNIKRFLRYLLASNAGEVLAVFFGVAGAGVLGLSGHGEVVAVPLLATQILWINLLTDLGPALAIGAEPYAADLMSRQPRKPTDRLIDGRMWRGVALTGIVMAVVTLVALDAFLPGGLIEGSESLDTARTAAFTVLVLTQLMNAFSARSETVSVVKNLATNRWLWGAVTLSALLQVAVVHVPLLNRAFSTAPLSVSQWATCVALSAVVPLVTELRKWGLRRRGV